MNDDINNPQEMDAARQADDRLMHGLLILLHDEQAAIHRRERVERVLRSIEESSSAPKLITPGPSRRPMIYPWSRRGAMALAAMMLIAVGIFVIAYRASPALASASDILNSLAQPGDRTFRIHVEPSDAAQTSHHGLDRAMLYLRDGRAFVLIRYAFSGGEVVDGYDGRQSWRVRRGEVVETKGGPGAGGIPVPQLMAEMPFVDLSQTLRRVREDYIVEGFAAGAAYTGGRSLSHLLARRKSPAVRGPETIEIWADARTGAPQRIVFDQAKFQGSTEPRRLIFEMISVAGLPEGWFKAGAHVAPSSMSK